MRQALNFLSFTTCGVGLIISLVIAYLWTNSYFSADVLKIRSDYIVLPNGEAREIHNRDRDYIKSLVRACHGSFEVHGVTVVLKRGLICAAYGCSIAKEDDIGIALNFLVQEQQGFEPALTYKSEPGLANDLINTLRPASVFGFAHRRALRPDSAMMGFSGRGHEILFPVWFPFILTLPFWLWFRRLIIRQIRHKRGCCLCCGYDLRASTGKCPECGTPIPGAARSN